MSAFGRPRGVAGGSTTYAGDTTVAGSLVMKGEIALELPPPLRPAMALTVLFGHDLSGDMEAHAVSRVVDDGRLDLCDRDAAVLVLATPVTTVRPRTLRSTALERSETLTAVGWGMTESGIPDRRRKCSGVTVLPSSSAGVGALGTNEILTTTAVCKGDSGGPLFDASGRVVSIVSRVRNGCAQGNGVHLLVRAPGVAALIERATSGI